VKEKEHVRGFWNVRSLYSLGLVMAVAGKWQGIGCLYWECMWLVGQAGCCEGRGFYFKCKIISNCIENYSQF